MSPIKSISELYERYPKTLKRLFSRLNLNYSGLEDVKALCNSQKFVEAAEELLRYYKEPIIQQRLKVEAPELVQKSEINVDLILDNKFEFPTGTITHKLQDNGCLEWKYLGPNNDVEYGYRINRFAWVPAAYEHYNKNKNDKIYKYLNKNLQCWILDNPRPLIKKNNAVWRVLEAGLRLLVSWPIIFYKIDHKDISPATKIMLLDNVYEQAQYVRFWHAFMGNHLVIEMDGLSTAATLWPEFKKSNKWLKVAAKNIQKELLIRQVYPDGLQKELSAHIHLLTLFHFDHFGQLIKYSSKNSLLKKDFWKKIESMWDYLAYCLKPDGNAPFNNDCPFFLRQWFPLIEEKAEEFGRDDWMYIATNGKKGQLPKKDVNFQYPYGGQVFMRSSWKSDSDWLFFDNGPSGISPSHLHRDKLNVCLFSHGYDLLIDTGFYHHIRDEIRNRYLNSTYGHNSIVIDERGQLRQDWSIKKPYKSNKFHVTNEYTFALGEYTGKYGEDKLGTRSSSYNKTKCKIIHIRAVLSLKDHNYLIFDVVKTDRPRDVKILWHFAPECNIIKENHDLMTDNNFQSNIRIHPLIDEQIKWDINIVSGQKTPRTQGWFSPKYGEIIPSPCGIYSTSIKSTTTFCWLLNTSRTKINTPFQTKISQKSQNFIEISLKIENIDKKIKFDWSEHPNKHFDKYIQLR